MTGCCESIAGELATVLAQVSLQAKNRVKAIFLDPGSRQVKLRLENRHFSRKVASVSEEPGYFAYAGNNPLTHIDPSGLDSCVASTSCESDCAANGGYGGTVDCGCYCACTGPLGTWDPGLSCHQVRDNCAAACPSTAPHTGPGLQSSDPLTGYLPSSAFESSTGGNAGTLRAGNVSGVYHFSGTLSEFCHATCRSNAAVARISQQGCETTIGTLSGFGDLSSMGMVNQVDLRIVDTEACDALLQVELTECEVKCMSGGLYTSANRPRLQFGHCFQQSDGQILCP
jgi:hypothetical protein